MEGLRNSPFTDARGFRGRDESVLLPDFRFGGSSVGLTGLGDLFRVEELKFGDGSLDDASVGSKLRPMLDGVLRDLAVPGRFKGV